MDIATSSKITFADRHELAHFLLKHHGGQDNLDRNGLA